MTGREEKMLKIEEKIREKLFKQPKILSIYYNSIEQKTAQTKQVYINYIIEYFKYLESRKINIYHEYSFKEIKKMDIDEYLAFTHYTKDKNGNRKINGESIRRGKIAAIKSFYDFLLDNGIIATNPCDKVKLPKLTKDISITILTQDEINTVKDRIYNESRNRERDFALFVLMIRTGLRVEEVIEINISDINFNKNTIIVTTKGNKRREIYFGDNTKEVLLNWIKVRGNLATDALFVNRNGERISYSTPQYMLNKYANDFGKRITCHKTRSTKASLTFDKTGDIYLVADALGHSNINNTRRYTKISEEKRKNVALISDEF